MLPMEAKNYEGGSEIINVEELRNKLIDLRKATAERLQLQRSRSATVKTKTKIPDDLKPSSEFFCDPTLFSLLRVYHESQGPPPREKKKSRSASAKGDKEDISVDINPETDTIKKGVRKSQAKDVMPGRLLDAEDEVRDIQDPHVPKKRQYLASNRMPAILFNAKKARLQFNENDNHNNTSAHANDADMPSNILEHSPYQLSEFDSESATPMDIDMESPSTSATPLALPPTSSRPVTYVAPADTPNPDDDHSNSEDDSENGQEEVNDDDQSDGEAEGNSLEAPPDDPRIGKTTLETRYLEMANLLDTSVLATLNPSNRLSVSGTQALQPNFLMADEGAALSTKKQKKLVKVRDNEIVLSVAIYQEKRPSRKLQEFNVLGSQTLASLRDAITCGSDIWMDSPSQASQASQARQARSSRLQNEPRDSGMTMTEVVRQRAKKRQYPSYFFINKCFYSDTRHPEVKNRADDPCDDIIKWINENERYKQRHLAGISKKSMQSVKFQDLEIQLNYPYLFCHQDVCKHILIFKDIWLHGQRDEMDASAYPELTFQCRMARSKCHMCQYWPAEFVTLNDVVSGYSPCFFCSRCYVPFHYDRQGKKLWDHEVRTYAL